MAIKETKVVISAETSKYERGMRNITRATLKTTREIKTRFKTASLVLLGIGAGAIAASRGFIELAMVQERAELSLGAAMKASREYSQAAHQGLKDFASGIQEVTEMGDEEVLMLATMIKNLGVSSNRLKDATKMSIGLATATGRSTKSMATYVAMAEQGNFTMLRRFIPALRSATDETEKMRIVQEFASRGFMVAEENAKSFSGQLKQMSNLWGDLHEKLGDVFIKNESVIKLMNTGKDAIAGWIDEVDRWAKVNDRLIAQKTEETISGIKVALKDIWTIISYDPAILQWGILGLAIGGRKSAVMGATLGHMITWVENLSKAMGLAASGILSFSEIANANFKQLEELVKRSEEKMETGLVKRFKIITEETTKPIKDKLSVPWKPTVPKEDPMIKWREAHQEASRQMNLQVAADARAARDAEWKKIQESYEKKIRTQKDFNVLYNEIGLTQFEIEKQRIFDMKQVFEEAEISKVKIKQWAVSEFEKINNKKIEAEIQQEQMKKDAQMDTLSTMVTGFKMMGEAGSKHSKVAFEAFKAFKLVEIAILTKTAAIKAYESMLSLGPAGPGLGIAAAAAVVGFGMQQAASVQALKAPSYDQGGISNAKGIYQTGNISEAHIPIPSGGKIPVKVDSGGQQPVQIIMQNPVFQDVETQRQVFAQIADVVARRVAPGAVVENYNNDGAIRSMVRSGE